MSYDPTAELVADGMTKPLGNAKIHANCSMYGTVQMNKSRMTEMQDS